MAKLLIVTCFGLYLALNIVMGAHITTRRKSQGKMREDRLDYALSEDKFVYAANFLKRFGYIKDDIKPKRLSENQLTRALIKPLKQFQRAHDIAVTGELDEATCERIVERRCASADDDDNEGSDAFTGRSTSRRGRRRSNVGELRAPAPGSRKSKWNKRNLTYKISNVPSRFDKGQVTRLIKQAAKQWEDASGLTLTFVGSNQPSDIDFSFTRIDEKWNVLGFARYPPIGRVTFDTAENWDFKDSNRNTRGTGGPRFRQVALHEFGHALGIRHLSKRNTIMFPTYSSRIDDILTRDDKLAVQNLFGNAPPRTKTRKSKSSNQKEKKNGGKNKRGRSNNSKTTKTRPRGSQTSTRSRNSRTNSRPRGSQARTNARTAELRVPQGRVGSATAGIRTATRPLISGVGNGRSTNQVSSNIRINNPNGQSVLSNLNRAMATSNFNIQSALIRDDGNKRSALVVENGEVVTDKAKQAAALREVFGNNNNINNNNINNNRVRTVTSNIVVPAEIDKATESVTTALPEPTTTTEAADSGNEETGETLSTTTESNSDPDGEVQTAPDNSETTSTTTESSAGTVDTGLASNNAEAAASGEPRSASLETAQSPRTAIADAPKLRIIKQAVIPSDVVSMLYSIRIVDLSELSNTKNWNGQFAWHPSAFTNRFMVMGLEDGLELVDFSSALSLTLQDADVWRERIILQRNAKDVLREGPAKIVSSNGLIHIVDKMRHCIVTISRTDFTVLAGSCGEPGDLDAARIASKFKSPVDMCVHSSGNMYILDQGNSKIKVLSRSTGSVTTFFNLPESVIFEAMFCSGETIYLSANNELHSSIYKVTTSPKIERVISLRRAAGRSGSLLAAAATAVGPFTQIIKVHSNILVNDGGLLREISMDRGTIYTICNGGQPTQAGEPGTCSISQLNGLHKLEDGNIFGLDIQGNKLIKLFTR